MSPEAPGIAGIIYFAAFSYYNKACADVAQAVEQRTEKRSAATKSLSNPQLLVSDLLRSRRQGLSSRTIQYYDGYLNRARHVVGFHITGQDIAQFLNHLGCSNGGKLAYYRAVRVSYNWLYSRKSGYNLIPEDNPILAVEAPKVEKKILP